MFDLFALSVRRYFNILFHEERVEIIPCAAPCDGEAKMSSVLGRSVLEEKKTSLHCAVCSLKKNWASSCCRFRTFDLCTCTQQLTAYMLVCFVVGTLTSRDYNCFIVTVIVLLSYCIDSLLSAFPNQRIVQLIVSSAMLCGDRAVNLLHQVIGRRERES